MVGVIWNISVVQRPTVPVFELATAVQQLVQILNLWYTNIRNIRCNYASALPLKAYAN